MMNFHNFCERRRSFSSPDSPGWVALGKADQDAVSAAGLGANSVLLPAFPGRPSGLGRTEGREKLVVSSKQALPLSSERGASEKRFLPVGGPAGPIRSCGPRSGFKGNVLFSEDVSLCSGHLFFFSHHISPLCGIKGISSLGTWNPRFMDFGQTPTKEPLATRTGGSMILQALLAPDLSTSSQVL